MQVLRVEQRDALQPLVAGCRAIPARDRGRHLGRMDVEVELDGVGYS